MNGGLEQFFGLGARGLGDVLAADHLGQFREAVVALD